MGKNESISHKNVVRKRSDVRISRHSDTHNLEWNTVWVNRRYSATNVDSRSLFPSKDAELLAFLLVCLKPTICIDSMIKNRIRSSIQMVELTKLSLTIFFFFMRQLNFLYKYVHCKWMFNNKPFHYWLLVVLNSRKFPQKIEKMAQSRQGILAFALSPFKWWKYLFWNTSLIL